MNRICLSLIILWSFLGLSGETVGADQTRIGKQIEEFSLRDYRGKVHSLNDYAQNKVLVVAFLGNDCRPASLAPGRQVSGTGKRLGSSRQGSRTRGKWARLGLRNIPRPQGEPRTTRARRGGEGSPIVPR